MGREIKFRAWDGDLKKMICGLGNMMTEWDSYRSYEVEDILKDESIMQFTGLSDKNGKEIYEGDIVKNLYLKFNQLLEVYWQEGEAKGEWLNKKPGFKFRVIDDNGNIGMKIFTPDTLEIIGNIYENKNLLK